MSNIMTALRELEQQEGTTDSKVHLVASSPAANDLSALEEFTSSQEQEGENCEEQAVAGEPQRRGEAVILFADDYLSVEERVVRVVEMVKRERQARLAAEERAENAEAEMSRLALRIEGFEQEMSALDSESDHRRQRIVGMVALLDSLDLSDGQ